MIVSLAVATSEFGRTTHASTACTKDEYIFNQIVCVFSSSSAHPYMVLMMCFPKCLSSHTQSLGQPRGTTRLPYSSFLDDSLPDQPSTTELDGELLTILQLPSSDFRRRVRESSITKDLVEFPLMMIVSVSSGVVHPTDVDDDVQRVHYYNGGTTTK